MKTQKKWNVKNKNEISKKKNDQKKFSGLKNFRTQSTSVSDNVSVTKRQCQTMSGSS